MKESDVNIQMITLRKFGLTLMLLNHFMLLVSFYTPRKHQKIYGFLVFSMGIDKDQWHETGQ